MVFEISAEGSDLIEEEEVKIPSPYIPSLESSTKTGFRRVEFNFNWYTFRVLFQGKFLRPSFHIDILTPYEINKIVWYKS